MDSRKIIKSEILKKSGDILSVNDAIWSFAETDMKEFKSSQLLCEVLEKNGFLVERGLAGLSTAFKATYGSGNPVIALLGEYDALPGLSQESGETSAKPRKLGGAGHGCGHNGIAAGCLAAAMAVKQYLLETGTTGTIVYFGCPGEESSSGKAYMAREGCFQDIDAAISWHPSDHTSVCWGGMLSLLKVNFRFEGLTAHASASPEKGRSALDAAELMSVGVNYLREHMGTGCRIHYAYLDAGGTAPNVVQDHSCVCYMLRSAHGEETRQLLERVKKIAKGAAFMTETECYMEQTGGTSEYLCNPTLGELLHEVLSETEPPEYMEKDYSFASEIFKKSIPAESVEQLKEKLRRNFKPEKIKELLVAPLFTELQEPWQDLLHVPGSTDVGDVSLVTPTAFFMGTYYTLGVPGHTWQLTAHGQTNLAHQAVLKAGEVLAETACRLYQNPSLCEKAREELESERGGSYICPAGKRIRPDMPSDEIKL